MEPTFDPTRDPQPELSPADADFELLMAYLDGELSPLEKRRAEQRLRAEPDLSAALDRMSAEHAIRQAVWESIEPSRIEAEAVAGKVARAAWWGEHSRRITAVYRMVGGAAACVALGFFAGWVGRGNTSAQATDATNPTPIVAAHLPGTNPAGINKNNDGPFMYQVALTDDDGNITAVQKFDRLEDARNFAADVGRWQARQAAINEGQPVVTSTGL